MGEVGQGKCEVRMSQDRAKGRTTHEEGKQQKTRLKTEEAGTECKVMGERQARMESWRPRVRMSRDRMKEWTTH